MPAKCSGKDIRSVLSNLQLADFGFDAQREIDVILGADVFATILLPGTIPGTNASPSAFNTHFGWVVTGPATCAVSTTVVVNHSNVELSEQLKQFWELEESPRQLHLTPEETKCESHFVSSYCRDAKGRFHVQLPVKNEPPELGKSRDIAYSRLTRIERNLERCEVRKKHYHDFMREYLDLGHMEIVPDEQRTEVVSKTYYLPHHCVTKEDSTTTSLRVVFDASAKSTSGVSLNDKLLVGPKLQDDIWDILMRFRLHPYALAADVTKMYRQVRVSHTDADLQRVLWRESPSDPVTEYRLTTLTYGTASAPYLAVKSLQQLAIDERDQFPSAAEATLRDFYVDDLLSGSKTIQEGLQLQAELIALLDRGGFHLRKWSSNNSALVESVPKEDRAEVASLCLDSQQSVKTLGIHWLPAQDSFFFSVQQSTVATKPSKRNVLSDIARIYDPLGLLSPVIVRAKILMQVLWTAGVSWDDSLPQALECEWSKFKRELPSLTNLRIQRCVAADNGAAHQLHGFCDASEQAYAASVYLRSRSPAGTVSVHLLASKTKVAPLKQVSLPRLELCGALLLARLAVRTQKTLGLELESTFAWTDSMVTLAWITGMPRQWKTFVANRVSEIQQRIPPDLWKHVPSEQNPADLASRGISPSQLSNNTLWWHGPSWLSNSSFDWPSQPVAGTKSIIAEQERRRLEVASTVATTSWSIIDKMSSLQKLVRTTAFCLRFVQNAKLRADKRVFGVLTAQELQNALHLCIKSAQYLSFKESLSQLQSGKPVTANLSSLNPFVDEKGVLRVGGRLRHSKFPYDQKFPILLPKQQHLTELIIRDAHENHLHAGPQATLAAIQQKYWIVNGRSVVRQSIHKCLKCHRDRACSSEQQQQMGDLPEHRLEPIRPFLRSGVDYCGPFTMKSKGGRGGKVQKVYVSLFICFATKAIHLELVTDLTADAFIAALTRFMARRGRCLVIYSDNGTNFVGANRELRQQYSQFKSQHSSTRIGEFLSTQGTDWRFIPARAPHFGGLWEAGVKSMKTHLRRVVGQAVLTYEELYTVLTQVEACLNSRPLCPLSSDPADMCALTPGHFLIGEALTSRPEPDLTAFKVNRLSRWQLTQQLQQHFWKRWQKEYICQLQQRSKWKTKEKNVECGDLVLLREENVPPLQWLRGRVVQVHPGSDGCVRVATVKTPTGEFKRPIAKLCPLPIS